eukprot:gnl/TRDRNA2_/TRDRNA2_172280_c3_seq1.p1 gnl/TRDRNA2_/TRDRNA2_172280_c3~~gnl/TRDRNA2_/TRDRNA2_172280_c3_seq1.p1  ORF type:complete len:241 (+),score=48.99 gnl/TRDRNA2_/TRDRNA2_172280_c3_seq1:149-871(+)
MTDAVTGIASPEQVVVHSNAVLPHEDKDIGNARAGISLEAMKARINRARMEHMKAAVASRSHRAKSDILGRASAHAGLISSRAANALHEQALAYHNQVFALQDQFDDYIRRVDRRMQATVNQIRKQANLKRKAAGGDRAARDGQIKTHFIEQKEQILLKAEEMVKHVHQQAAGQSGAIEMQQAERQAQMNQDAILAAMKLNHMKIRADAEASIARTEREAQQKLFTVKRQAVDDHIFATR